MLHINNLAFNLNVNYAANATEAATFYARHYTVPVRCQILMYSICSIHLRHVICKVQWFGMLIVANVWTNPNLKFSEFQDQKY